MQQERKADLRGCDSQIVPKHHPQHPSREGKALSIRFEAEARHAFPFLRREKIHEPVNLATTSATVGVPEVQIAIVEWLDGEGSFPCEIKIETAQVSIGNAGGVWHHGKRMPEALTRPQPLRHVRSRILLRFPRLVEVTCERSLRASRSRAAIRVLVRFAVVEGPVGAADTNSIARASPAARAISRSHAWA